MPTRYDPISGQLITVPNSSNATEFTNGPISPSNPLSVMNGGTGRNSFNKNAVLLTDTNGQFESLVMGANQVVYGTSAGPQVLSLAPDQNISIQQSGNQLQIKNLAAFDYINVAATATYSLTNKQCYFICNNGSDSTTGNLIFNLGFDYQSGNRSARIVGSGYKNYQINMDPSAVIYMGDTKVTNMCVSTSPFCSLEAICVNTSPLTWILVPQEGNFAIS